jgi:hypothetical protein
VTLTNREVSGIRTTRAPAASASRLRIDGIELRIDEFDAKAIDLFLLGYEFSMMSMEDGLELSEVGHDCN